MMKFKNFERTSSQQRFKNLILNFELTWMNVYDLGIFLKKLLDLKILSLIHSKWQTLRINSNNNKTLSNSLNKKIKGLLKLIRRKNLK